jgi:hypothetical protein
MPHRCSSNSDPVLWCAGWIRDVRPVAVLLSVVLARSLRSALARIAAQGVFVAQFRDA